MDSEEMRRTKLFTLLVHSAAKLMMSLACSPEKTVLHIQHAWLCLIGKRGEEGHGSQVIQKDVSG